MRAFTRFLLASCALAALCAAPASAQSSVEAFYKGRTVELVVGTLPGGGYDLYGRLIARYIGRHIPGQPTVIVKQHAGRRASAHGELALQRRAARRLRARHHAAVDRDRAGARHRRRAVRRRALHLYRPRRAGGRGHLHLAHVEDANRSPTRARARPSWAAPAHASPTVFYLKALNALAGTKFRVVAGFRGVSETELAVQRGEVEGGTKAWASMKVDNAQWLRDKQVNIILQYALERAPDLPDVPMMAELGLDARATAALKLFAAGNAMGRSIFATPGIPAERAAALRKAFMDTMADPELIAFTRERNIDLGPALTGEALAQLVAETLSVSPETAAEVRKARGE